MVALTVSNAVQSGMVYKILAASNLLVTTIYRRIADRCLPVQNLRSSTIALCSAIDPNTSILARSPSNIYEEHPKDDILEAWESSNITTRLLMDHKDGTGALQDAGKTAEWRPDLVNTALVESGCGAEYEVVYLWQEPEQLLT